MNQSGFDWAFNLPYSPNYNGIERYFSAVKHNYRQKLLQSLELGD
jgi:hypothetical protein